MNKNDFKVLKKVNDKKPVLTISSDENGKYDVKIAKGASVREGIFCVNVFVRCLIRDGLIKNTNEFFNILRTYLENSEYNEVKEK